MENKENINKKDESNTEPKRKETVVMVGGGFDPLHLGHLLQLKAAKALGDKLIVVLDADDWLKKKKGINFMPTEDRVAIMQELRCVDQVIIIGGGDPTDVILNLRPDIYAHGGDKDSISTMLPTEVEACKKVGCKIVFNMGGPKIRSSSHILKRWVDFQNNKSNNNNKQ